MALVENRTYSRSFSAQHSPHREGTPVIKIAKPTKETYLPHQISAKLRAKQFIGQELWYSTIQEHLNFSHEDHALVRKLVVEHWQRYDRAFQLQQLDQADWPEYQAFLDKMLDSFFYIYEGKIGASKLARVKEALLIGAFYQTLTPEDLQFWTEELGGQPPFQIILATSSVRKAVMNFYLLNGLQFPGDQKYHLPDDPDQAAQKQEIARVLAGRVGSLAMDLLKVRHKIQTEDRTWNRGWYRHLVGRYLKYDRLVEYFVDRTIESITTWITVAHQEDAQSLDRVISLLAAGWQPDFTQAGVSHLPLDLDEFFEKTIYNGDSQLQAKARVGTFHGVEVWVHPQSGESDSNEQPMAEALNKVDSVVPPDFPLTSFVIASDTVDFSEVKKKNLGKPFKMENSPSDDAEQAEILAFAEWYKAEFYPAGANVDNRNGIALRDTLAHAVVTTILELKFMADQEKLATAQMRPYNAGGGISQQVVNWEGSVEELLTAVVDPAYKHVFYEVATDRNGELDRDRVMWLLYTSIIGMPWLGLYQLIENQVRNNGQHILK